MKKYLLVALLALGLASCSETTEPTFTDLSQEVMGTWTVEMPEFTDIAIDGADVELLKELNKGLRDALLANCQFQRLTFKPDLTCSGTFADLAAGAGATVEAAGEFIVENNRIKAKLQDVAQAHLFSINCALEKKDGALFMVIDKVTYLDILAQELNDPDLTDLEKLIIKNQINRISSLLTSFKLPAKLVRAS